jgi:hypothetical protein
MRDMFKDKRLWVIIGAVAILLIASWWAYGQVTAVWTGRSELFTSVTGRQGVRCEYQASGMRNFWRSFEGLSCPATLKIW